MGLRQIDANFVIDVLKKRRGRVEKLECALTFTTYPGSFLRRDGQNSILDWCARYPGIHDNVILVTDNQKDFRKAPVHRPK
jgi:hypothetical protein